MKRNLRKFTYIFFIILIILGLFCFNRVKIKDYFQEIKKEPTPEAVSLEEIEKTKKEPFEVKEITIPDQINLDVPFTSQAPYADWSEPWQNACEEAALLMVHHFLAGDKKLTKEQVKNEILEMIDFQIKNYGSHKDLYIEEVASLARDYYGYQEIEVKYDITLEDIKKEVSQKNPVIVPVYGRILGNPYYRQPGPIYHMLVVVGYTPKIIITNDPGTRKGDEFQYSYQTFFNAIHDWVEGALENPDLMKGGRKAMLVIRKK